MRKLFNSRVACPTGLGLDRAFYRSILKSQHTLKFPTANSDGVISLLSPKQKPFALLDIRAMKALLLLQEKVHVHFEIIILPVDKGTSQAEPQSYAETRDSSINIYGAPKLAGQVGDTLADAGQYLQHPFLLDVGMDYRNPHYFVNPVSMTNLNSLVKHRLCGSTSEINISREVSKLLDSLDSVGTELELPRKEGIKTSLLRSVTSQSI